MALYSYECPTHGSIPADFPLGEAAKQVSCSACGADAPRIYGDVSMQFTYGREDFHGPTLTERIRKQESECAADGVKMEPAGARWV